MTTTSLRLPLPPSANEYWRAARGRGLVPSKEAEVYKQRVARICAAFSARPIRGPFSISITAYGLRANADLDNVLKVLLDACEMHLFMNDKDAWRINIERGETSSTEKWVYVAVVGDEYATADEVTQARIAKAERNRKRKMTLAARRLGKSMLQRSVVRP